FDMLPSGDRRRSSMGHRLFSHFIELQRYADALEVMPYHQLHDQFERFQAIPDRIQQKEAMKEANRRLVINSGLDAIEVLAGAAHLDEAREMQAKLLAFDNASGTTDALKKRLDRAKHPELLAR